MDAILLDEDLVERAQGGDRGAFDQLVLKYQSRIVRLVERLVGEADGLDVAQETFVRAYRALASFEGKSAFFTWLYRIAINTAKNFRVARRRRPAAQDIDVADAESYGHMTAMSHGDTPEALAISGELGEKVTETIGRLPEDLRQAVTMRDFEGLPYEDIALAMGCPIGTVRSRIFRARAVIGEEIGTLLK